MLIVGINNGFFVFVLRYVVFVLLFVPYKIEVPSSSTNTKDIKSFYLSCAFIFFSTIDVSRAKL